MAHPPPCLRRSGFAQAGIEGGGDNLLLLQEIFIPPVSSACKAQPQGGGFSLSFGMLQSGFSENF